MKSKTPFATALAGIALSLALAAPLPAAAKDGAEAGRMEVKTEIHRCDARLMKAVEDIRRGCSLRQVLR